MDNNNIEQLKDNIREYIKQNGNKDITGQILQEVLLGMVDGLVGNDAVANPEGEATETLAKIKIGETIYTAPQGPAGQDGQDGINGVTPHIGDNGNWYIGDQDTGVQAEGQDGTNGTNGITPTINPDNKHWMIGETDTGIVAEGQNGQNGQNAVNPFKGWFDAVVTGEVGSRVITSETQNLPENPIVGDYAYLKTWEITGTAPQQVETPITKIYECTTAGSWSDSGRTADTSNVQTFASSQKVNDVHIVNDLTTGGVDDVLSAEQGKVLNSEINGEYGYVNQTPTLTDGKGYRIANNKVSGPTATSNCMCCDIDCAEGDKFKIYGRGSSTVPLYIVADSSGNVLDTILPSVPTTYSGLEIVVPQNGVKLYLSFTTSGTSQKSVYKYILVVNGIKQHVEQLDSEITELSDSLDETVAKSDMVHYVDYILPMSLVLKQSNSDYKNFVLPAGGDYQITLHSDSEQAELNKLQRIYFCAESDLNSEIYSRSVKNMPSGEDITFKVTPNSNVNYVIVTRLSNFSENVEITISAKRLEDVYVKTENVDSIFDKKRQSETGLSLNVFGDILPSSFKEKLFSEDDVLIAIQGDSIVGKIEDNNVSADPSHDAPGAQYQSFVSIVQKNVSMVRPTYNRLDSVVDDESFYEKVGTWEVATSDTFSPSGTPEINDRYKESSVAARTYRSNSDDCAVNFVFDADKYNKCNIVFSINKGAAEAQVTIEEGNGKMLASIDRTNWYEANGFTHSQASNGVYTDDGNAWCERHRRVWLKKVDGVIGEIHIAYSRTTNDSKYMYCWGTEMYFGKAVFFDNIGRGGRTIELLSLNISDVFDRNPDLAIIELPLINDAYHYSTINDWKAALDKYFLNNTYGYSYRVRSNDYTICPLLVLLPHTRSSAFSGDSAKMMSASQQFIRTMPAYNIWKLLWGYLQEQLKDYDNVKFVDICDVFLNEAKFRYGTIGTGLSTGKMTADSTHLNQIGSNVYSKYLSPIFYV